MFYRFDEAAACGVALVWAVVVVPPTDAAPADARAPATVPVVATRAGVGAGPLPSRPVLSRPPWMPAADAGGATWGYDDAALLPHLPAPPAARRLPASPARMALDASGTGVDDSSGSSPGPLLRAWGESRTAARRRLRASDAGDDDAATPAAPVVAEAALQGLVDRRVAPPPPPLSAPAGGTEAAGQRRPSARFPHRMSLTAATAAPAGTPGISRTPTPTSLLSALGAPPSSLARVPSGERLAAAAALPRLPLPLSLDVPLAVLHATLARALVGDHGEGPLSLASGERRPTLSSPLPSPLPSSPPLPRPTPSPPFEFRGRVWGPVEVHEHYFV
jgi:hypothetical protein